MSPEHFARTALDEGQVSRTLSGATLSSQHSVLHVPRVGGRPSDFLTQSATRFSDSPENGVLFDPSPAHCKIGIYGWRKRFLYLLVLFILVVAILNISLTIWIVRVMKFHLGGMGAVQLGTESITIDGNARFRRSVRVTKIIAGGSSPLLLESSRNLTMRTTDVTGRERGSLTLTDDALVLSVDDFWVKSRSGETLLRAQRNRPIEIGGERVNVVNEGGSNFVDGIETKSLTAPPGRSLEVVSRSNCINLVGSKGVTVVAKSGGMNVRTLDDIVMTTKGGKIKFDADVRFVDLPVVEPRFSEETSTASHAYQLCVCGNGKVFLADSLAICSNNDEACA